jgi:hypothetical protein
MDQHERAFPHRAVHVPGVARSVQRRHPFAYLQNPQEGQLTIGAQDRSGTVGQNFYFNGRGNLPLNDLRLQTSGLPIEQQPVPVPEPATLTLLASGLALSTIGRLRKSSR